VSRFLLFLPSVVAGLLAVGIAVAAVLAALGGHWLLAVFQGVGACFLGWFGWRNLAIARVFRAWVGTGGNDHD
jgi:hypothetical protein